MLVFIGYALSAAGRFSLGLAGSGAQVFGLRLTDGLGKGLKDAPRDALVASSAGTRKLGMAFEIQRMLDTLGSFAGPLITYFLARFWTDQSAYFRPIFLIAGVVAMIPLLLIGLFVRERKLPVKKQAISLAVFRGPFAGFLLIMLLFTLGNSSDAFIILRAQNVGVAAVLIPVVYALFNLTSALTAVPAGWLADRIGRRRVLAYGWGIYALAYLGFALARSSWLIWVLWAFYGLYYALTEGSAKAMIAELVAEENRGAAYGLFSASVGVMALPASLIAGALWSNISPAAPFVFGALLAGLAFVGLCLLPEPAR